MFGLTSGCLASRLIGVSAKSVLAQEIPDGRALGKGIVISVKGSYRRGRWENGTNQSKCGIW